MELKKLGVHNYKSLVNFELNEPNAFTVFAGPNGAGKSNIFEALEFERYNSLKSLYDIEDFFGGKKAIVNANAKSGSEYKVELNFAIARKYFYGSVDSEKMKTGFEADEAHKGNEWQVLQPLLQHFENNFLRLFIKNEKVKRVNITSSNRLLPDASNLESVLKRILKNEIIKEEF